MTRQPTYHFRTVRKGLLWADAQKVCADLKTKRPDVDYRVVRLDGANPYYAPEGGVYRVLLLRDASSEPMYEQEP